MSEMLYRCYVCKRYLPASEFHKNRSNSCGHSRSCKVCTKDVIQESRLKTLSEMERNPNDKRHGTITGYSAGCRCDKCKRIKNEKHKAWKERRKNANNHS